MPASSKYISSATHTGYRVSVGRRTEVYTAVPPSLLLLLLHHHPPHRVSVSRGADFPVFDSRFVNDITGLFVGTQQQAGLKLTRLCRVSNKSRHSSNSSSSSLAAEIDSTNERRKERNELGCYTDIYILVSVCVL